MRPAETVVLTPCSPRSPEAVFGVALGDWRRVDVSCLFEKICCDVLQLIVFILGDTTKQSRGSKGTLIIRRSPVVSYVI